MLAPSLSRILGFGFPALEAEAGAVAFFGTVPRGLFLLSLFILLARPCSAAPWRYEDALDQLTTASTLPEGVPRDRARATA